MNLSVKDLLAISYQRAHRFSKLSPNQKFSNVSTDSRSVRRGDLFVALRGEQFDGHNFVQAAKEKGAKAVVVDARWFKKNAKLQLPAIVVKNTLDAYGELARIYRRKFSLPILVVAGSNGKTTNKDLIAHVLGTSFNVLKTESNFNNQVGLPQMLFQLKKEHGVAVLEIGTNHPGEIAWLTNVAEPTHALVTNIGREHLEFFKNLDGVAREELASLAITEELGGFGFLNWDDPYIRQMQPLFQEWSITYGSTSAADLTAKSLGLDTKGKHCVEVRVGKEKIRVNVHIIADYAPNLIAAVTAVALHFNVSKAKIKKALESYRPHSKRMEIVHTRRGVLVINDAYNANPDSFKSALSTLDRLRTKAKKYVVAGDMFELGSASTKEHRALGKLMSVYPFSKLYLSGDAMRHTYSALKTKKRLALYGSKEVILDDIMRTVKRGDVVLVKGSRGMRMEDIVRELQQ